MLVRGIYIDDCDVERVSDAISDGTSDSYYRIRDKIREAIEDVVDTEQAQNSED